MPVRIRRERLRGWKAPEGAVYVGRPGKFGNPFKVDAPSPRHGFPMSREEAVAAFRETLDADGFGGWLTKTTIREELAGKDLVCWCPLDGPCHADVLLEIANQ